MKLLFYGFVFMLLACGIVDCKKPESTVIRKVYIIRVKNNVITVEEPLQDDYKTTATESRQESDADPKQKPSNFN